MDATEWTLEELAARVAEALDGAAYPGAPNGRVRDVPDARAIRWYSTIGLVDRPSGMRGRTALYGPRHLLQLVAVKRRQAQGHRLADIQAELAGAPDDDLRRIAGLPAVPAVPAVPADPAVTAAGTAMPAARTAMPASAPAAPVVPVVPVVPAVPAKPQPVARAKFWAERPAAPRPRTLGGVDLGGDALLVLPQVPTDADAAAIRAAARPLIDLLAQRGLINHLSAETTE